MMRCLPSVFPINIQSLILVQRIQPYLHSPSHDGGIDLPTQHARYCTGDVTQSQSENNSSQTMENSPQRESMESSSLVPLSELCASVVAILRRRRANAR